MIGFNKAELSYGVAKNCKPNFLSEILSTVAFIVYASAQFLAA